MIGNRRQTSRRRRRISAAQFPFEFHISRAARDRYGFDETLFATTGNVVFQDVRAVRRFVERYNAHIDLLASPERALRAGAVNAMGLIDEILHQVVRLYREATGIDPFAEIESRLRPAMGASFDACLRRFTEEFPPQAVYRGGADPAAHLEGSTAGISNRSIALEEMMLLWLANANPAFAPYREFFDDGSLRATTLYPRVALEFQRYFGEKPPFGPDRTSLFEMLQAPSVAHPSSLQGQLGYIRDRWGALLGRYLLRLLGGLDALKEEEKRPGGGPGPSVPYRFEGETEEREKFSTDLEWMPKVILIAKSTLVWLDQLSKQYGQPILSLDQIPDAEIDRLASRGFTALWLIGLWERSAASKRIKQLGGNPEAEASAYSLRSYEISADLGGWQALENLRDRCARRGLRLASDMVPNHTGIDSDWVLRHPERFIQSGASPFPSYRYSGENLSPDSRIGVFLEDHYFDKSDAAVTFRRTDFSTGETRYLYHGNDGTHMPWNDTAQLNFLDAAVREAVIQTILHVARNFPIIRFDAAMTLAKRHIERLWFPEPGSGGDIPSRSDFALSKADFDQAMPHEFWREVVDRVGTEVPDTLLLAEAFWMMEGYFVRTLGMHRVYNSAFMNMLKDEENQKYRATVKNTLEFDPEILRRFVNFMNNPDEETAVVQFGTGGKYFGVCTLMVTMPGLPMFGHGQVEGFAEKYGMEYRRAYRDERPNEELVRRHEREIFPLMKLRRLFAEVEHFRFYDFQSSSGSVDENVFAYSNGDGWDRALVLYNNRMERTEGRLHDSVPFSTRGADGARQTQRTTLGESLALHGDGRHFTLLTEQRSGLSYLRSSAELAERGLHAQLEGYESQVFLAIREIEDNDFGHYGRLCALLGGKGFADLDVALRSVFLEPVHGAFAAITAAGQIDALFDPESEIGPDSAARSALRAFFRAGAEFSGGSVPEALVETTASTAKRMGSLLRDRGGRSPYGAYLAAGLDFNRCAKAVLGSWLFLRSIGDLLSDGEPGLSRSLIDEWQLGGLIERSIEAAGGDGRRHARTVKLLVRQKNWFRDLAPAGTPEKALGAILADEDVRVFVGENRYEGTLWFNRESYLDLVWWLFVAALVEIDGVGAGKGDEEAIRLFEIVRAWLAVVDESGYRVERLIELLHARAEAGSAGDKR